VEITRPFYLGVFPVTQAQWQKVMGNNPSYFSATGGGKDKVKGMNTADFPVEQVSWEEARVFLQRLSALETERRAGRSYRLPTEAEWEYACRGGGCSSTPFHFGSSLSSTQANFDGRYPYGGGASGPYLERTCAVGSYRPNAFGLYDMHGNVYEWCADFYDEHYYSNSPKADPRGPSEGWRSRVMRGGGWRSESRGCRSAYRYWHSPDQGYFILGFRAALDLK
jgi:formylglycine-generating enzyme required for sulfatase activity